MNLDSINVGDFNNSAMNEQSDDNLSNTQEHNFTLRESVELSMKNYFSQLGDERPSNIYDLVLAEVEAPLMEAVMNYTQGNQTKASQVLGLNRGTLRKKLKAHGLN